MRRIALVLALLVAGQGARAEQLVTGLSQDDVSITANFNGSDILIYGAVKRDAPIPPGGLLEVIVTVEGPSAPIIVRRKSRKFGVWINTAAVTVDSAPSFYAVATTGALSRILSDTEDLRRKISIPRAIRSVGAPSDILDSASFTEALIRLRQNSRDYVLAEGSVQLSEQTLFRTDIDLPANLTEGDYRTRIFLLRNKTVIDERSEIINVRKVGLERWLYNLAHFQPMLHGFLALVLAALAGWGASTLFRFIRS